MILPLRLKFRFIEFKIVLKGNQNDKTFIGIGEASGKMESKTSY
jgi:hypothetical protein